MKIHFDSSLEYQKEAIEAVCNLFDGQDQCQTEFTLTKGRSAPGSIPVTKIDLGIGNKLILSSERIFRNLRKVQMGNGITPDASPSGRDFTVEMETGTGKTYVYLRTIFELNRRFGFTKFIIVVPTIAIKEGVYKTLQITSEHFKSIYSGVVYDYFLYDSAAPVKVKDFASNESIQIMVVTVGAINKKDVNNLYKDSEKSNGEKPIDIIRSTRPILIVDEPQSVEGGLEGQGRKALEAMDPLCTLRYSATHANEYSMVFRLDAVDAYQRKLVKQIEVASATIEDAHNKPFVRVVSLDNKKGRISARIEVDVDTAIGVKRNEISVTNGDSLEELSGRTIYSGFSIGTVNTAVSGKYMELSHGGDSSFLKIGETYGDVNVSDVMRKLIRRTIKEHFDKELLLKHHGVKVLSLFFIDEVAKYRIYDKDGTAMKGKYANIFEEEFIAEARQPKYEELFKGIDIKKEAIDSHNGYFSIDKKNGWTDTKEGNTADRENAERAYSLIMKDKEKLLSFDTRLRFIFSHSALKEGWDNPNIFQICTLRNIRTERERRQTIGRGLRLCVDQSGNRISDITINTLTVIANESYTEFAKNLQREIEKDTGIRFGIVEKHAFAMIEVKLDEGQSRLFGEVESEKIWQQLKDQGYIDEAGKVLDPLRVAIKDDSLGFAGIGKSETRRIIERLKKISVLLEIKNADERKTISPRKDASGKAVYLGDEFKELWNKVKYKTKYRVQFNEKELVESCIEELKKGPAIFTAILQWRKADISVSKSGITANQKTGSDTLKIEEGHVDLPDILTVLEDKTHLPRKTIANILGNCGRINDFKENPQLFIEIATKVINLCKKHLMVKGIKYQRIGEDDFYAQELFGENELKGYMKNILKDTPKSIYEDLIFDSNTEKEFALAMEENNAIRLYAKLPNWFKIPTPLGTYNPDWAVLVERDGEERLYFVVETKNTKTDDDLSRKEEAKMECGSKHFEALAEGQDNPAIYKQKVKTVDDFLKQTLSIFPT